MALTFDTCICVGHKQPVTFRSNYIGCGTKEVFFLLSFTSNYVVSSSSGCLESAALLAHLSRRLIGELIVYGGVNIFKRLLL